MTAPPSGPPPSLASGLGTAFGLALGPAAVLGLGRFAYALLLPPMRDTLDWSFATAGMPNTAHALGYLAGSLVAAAAGARWGARRMFLAGIVLSGLAGLLSAATADVAVLSGLRVIAGAAAAVTFILGGGLAALSGQGHRPGRAALLLAVYFAGPALGIVVSGLTIAPLLVAVGDTGWRWGWLALGCLTLLALAGTLPALRRTARAPVPVPGDRLHRRGLTVPLAIYGLFGIGYIAYMTFIVAYLREQGATPAVTIAFWLVLGVCGLVGGSLWGPLLGRLPGHRGPALVLAVVSLGAAVPVLSPAVHGAGRLAPAFVSAALFGSSFLAVATAVTTAARRSLPPTQWTAAIGLLTVVFAGGQCLGPVLTGAISDGPGGLRTGMLVSIGVLTLAAVVAVATDGHATRAHPPNGPDPAGPVIR